MKNTRIRALAALALACLTLSGCSQWGANQTAAQTSEALPALATAAQAEDTAPDKTEKAETQQTFETTKAETETQAAETTEAETEKTEQTETVETAETAETEPPETTTLSDPAAQLAAETFATAAQNAAEPAEEAAPAAASSDDFAASDKAENFTFSDSYNAFLSGCVFVGDSICSGLRVYEILPTKSVVAQGNTAARNIFEFSFRSNGEDVDLLTALERLDPKYIVFSMGMNDVNMTSQAQFCANYGDILSKTEARLPNAKLIVLSVTPIISTSKFTKNTNIDSFNAALREYLDSSGKWTYAEVSAGLKNSLNALKTPYDGGDGIHLAPAAYYAILYRLCERMVDGKVYEQDGTFSYITPELEETAESETTAPETVPETKKTKKKN